MLACPWLEQGTGGPALTFRFRCPVLDTGPRPRSSTGAPKQSSFQPSGSKTHPQRQPKLDARFSRDETPFTQAAKVESAPTTPSSDAPCLPAPGLTRGHGAQTSTSDRSAETILISAIGKQDAPITPTQGQTFSIMNAVPLRLGLRAQRKDRKAQSPHHAFPPTTRTSSTQPPQPPTHSIAELPFISY